MKLKCIECEKEAEELIQLEGDNNLFVCEDCYDTITKGMLNIIKYMENKFK